MKIINPFKYTFLINLRRSVIVQGIYETDNPYNNDFNPEYILKIKMYKKRGTINTYLYKVKIYSLKFKKVIYEYICKETGLTNAPKITCKKSYSLVHFFINNNKKIIYDTLNKKIILEE